MNEVTCFPQSPNRSVGNRDERSLWGSLLSLVLGPCFFITGILVILKNLYIWGSHKFISFCLNFRPMSYKEQDGDYNDETNDKEIESEIIWARW